MNIYKVGGFVRDHILGHKSTDVDYVVVGGSHDEMLELKFQQVGKGFPVYLHPKTGAEYALARTERKTGQGHVGFECQTEGVSLEEDLSRRDLTINSMAMASDGSIIDPFGGQEDLKWGILRHTSPAFTDDPLRTLRVARFAARFNFSIAPETEELMRSMKSEMKTLTAERVWGEIEKALKTDRPFRFIQVLSYCDILGELLPELKALEGVPQPPEHHPEGTVDAHLFLVMEEVCKMTSDPVIRFAALMHDLGKGNTPKEELPRHLKHEERGVELIEGICNRFKIPNEFKQLAVLVSKYHLQRHQAFTLRPGSVVDLLNHLKCRHGLDLLNGFLIACEADARGRGGEVGKRPQPQSDYLRQCGKAMREIKVVDRTEEFKERLKNSTDPDEIAAMHKRLERANDPQGIVGRLTQAQCKSIEGIRKQFKDDGSVE